MNEGIEMKYDTLKIPALCAICKYREGFECLMQGVDIRNAEWLNEFDGCNQFLEI